MYKTNRLTYLKDFEGGNIYHTVYPKKRHRGRGYVSHSSRLGTVMRLTPVGLQVGVMRLTLETKRQLFKKVFLLSHFTTQ